MIKRGSIYVTRPLPVEALSLLKERCNVEMHSGYDSLPKPKLIEKIKECDAVVVVSTSIDDEILQAVKSRCRLFASYGVGYNSIDVEAATKHGILVSNTPDVVTSATADLAWALLLATARRVVECDRFVRAGQKDWSPTNLIGLQVSGKTLGIIGGGRIGLATARRAMGFDMNIIYTDVQHNSIFESSTGGRYVDKERLFQTADFISCHIPLFPSTRHFVGASELRLMKKTGVLINTARGPVVDEKALVEALRGGALAGAGLDVFEYEPELAEGLAALPNVVLTPHVGTSTLDTRIAMGNVVARNIFSSLDDELPPNCVNPEAKCS